MYSETKVAQEQKHFIILYAAILVLSLNLRGYQPKKINTPNNS